ncbi:MAG: hypothetical protein K1W05_01575, partial [Desulfovibrio sp.]
GSRAILTSGKIVVIQNKEAIFRKSATPLQTGGGTMMFRAVLLFVFCLCLSGCGSRAASVGEGIRGEAAELGREINVAAQETERVAVAAGEDIVDMAKGEDTATTDLHELSGTNSPQNQQEHARQMAALCDTSEANIRALRKKGLTWEAIAAKYGLKNNGHTVWQAWDNATPVPDWQAPQ